MPPFSLAFGRSIRFSPFLQDLAWTVVTSLATIVALVLFARVAADRLGPTDFGALMLARRVIATLDPVSTFSMGIALTRFAAVTRGSEQGRVLVAGTLFALVTAGVFCSGGLLASRPLAAVLFGDSAYAPLVRSSSLMVLAYSAFIVLYAWYRGTERMALANAWQIWAIAAGPVAVALLFAGPGRAAAIVAGLAGVLATAALPLGWELLREARVDRPVDRATLQQLAAYSLPRIPGGLAFGGLLAVAPLMAPHVASMAAVGYVATGQALLRVVEGATEAFGRVALAKIAQLYAAGEHLVLRERIADVTAVVVHVGLFGTCQLWLWAPELIRGWLGPDYEPGIPAVRLVVLAILPYLLFVTLRSVLDAVEKRAVNAWNLYAAIAVTGAGSALFGPQFGAEGLSAAMSAGLLVLGVLTVVALRRRYPFPLAPLLLPQAVAANLVLAGLAAVLRVAAARAEVPPLAAAAAAAAVLAVVYASALWQMDARWMHELTRRVHVGSV